MLYEVITDDIAKELLMSRTQLHRKIKSLTGKSLIQYANHIRVEKAKHLLLNSELQIRITSYNVCYTKLLRTPDGCDACPNSATGDSDGDGICDDLDICPNGDDNIDTDSDGIPDACDVITSYSIHYTKLYDHIYGGTQDDSTVFGPAEEYTRITSYNVCYTKLLRVQYSLTNAQFHQTWYSNP